MSTFQTSILITGGTQGMGYFATLELAKKRPQILIVIASRTDPSDAASKINNSLNQSNVKYLPLDLGSVEKVRTFAQRWKEEKLPRLEALLCNAGVQIPGETRYTADSIELQFGINHVGHALLTHLLIEYMTDDARVVITSSGVHDPAEKWGWKVPYTTAAEVARPSKESMSKYAGVDRYSASKAANVIWMYALARRFAAEPRHRSKIVVAWDPGFMPGTGLQREMGSAAKFVLGKVIPKVLPIVRGVTGKNMRVPQESAQSLAWLATAEEGQGRNGVYFEQKTVKESSALSRQKETQEDLWTWTVDFVAKGEEEKSRFERVQ